MKTTRRNFIKGALAWLGAAFLPACDIVEGKQKAAEEDEPACPLYLCDIYGQFRDSENSVYGIPITAAIEDLPSCELGYIECPTVSMNVSPASTYLARKEIDDLRQGLVAWWPPPEPGTLYKPVDDWAFWEKPDGCVETTWRFPFGYQSFLSEDDDDTL
jgi:hypothetical protein